jgi:hypothetical protein
LLLVMVLVVLLPEFQAALSTGRALLSLLLLALLLLQAWPPAWGQHSSSSSSSKALSRQPQAALLSC